MMLDHWIQQGQGYLLVFDITNKESFEKLKMFRERILKFSAVDGCTSPVVVAGNKCDLRNDTDTSQVKKSAAIELSQDWGYKYYDTSAKNGIDHEAVFDQIVRELRKQESLKLV